MIALPTMIPAVSTSPNSQIPAAIPIGIDR